MFQGEPGIETGFVGSLLCFQQQRGAAEPAADSCLGYQLFTSLHSEQQYDGSIVSRRMSQHVSVPTTKRRCLEEDQCHCKKNHDDNSADLSPPPPEDNDISTLVETPWHPHDNVSDGYPSYGL
jgi:hypothetical protein